MIVTTSGATKDIYIQFNEPTNSAEGGGCDPSQIICGSRPGDGGG